MERDGGKLHNAGVMEGEGGKLHVLVVYAHEEPKSFNGALKDVICEALRNQGHTVVVSDLYAMKFNPVASRNDIVGELRHPEHFKYSDEMEAAYRRGALSEDVSREQAKVHEADLIILQFPMWYSGFPAIMKGWMDRVLQQGFAYDGEHMCDEGLMKGKRVLLSFTTGGTSTMYSSYGLFGDIAVLAWSLICPFRFVGFDILRTQIFTGIETNSENDRKLQIDRCKERLQYISSEKPQYFVPLRDFDIEEGHVLPQSVANGRRTGLTSGQHLGLHPPPPEESVWIM